MGDGKHGQTSTPLMHGQQTMSLLIGEGSVGFGVIAQLSPQRLWIDHKISRFVIIRVKGGMVSEVYLTLPLETST